MSAEPAAPPPAGLAATDFASDNHAGVHPEVLEAIAAANAGHAGSYGADPQTARAEELFREHFGDRARGFCLFNGTGANVASVAAVCRPHEAVICTETAHMQVDECGAPEQLAGVKLLTVATEHGKLDAADVGRWDAIRGDEHHVQPRVVSITQSTELGTLYEPGEVRAIADAAHERGMLLHIDGARLANAAVALETTLAAVSTEAGADLVSFGGTKNGLLGADAVVFADRELADGFEFTRKRLGQLASKMRFVSAQFVALLEGDLWRTSAAHANAMGTRLGAAVEPIDGVEVLHPVQVNAVFARLERRAIDKLLAELDGDHPFYVWDASRGEVRWMCAWDTQPEEVDAFADTVAAAVAG